MWIEATISLTVKLPTGDFRLTPGVPIEIPVAQAQRLLIKAEGKVRESIRDWSPTWRELADLTSGLTVEDPRLPVVMGALTECDNTYLRGDWVAFRQAAARVRSAMEGRILRAEP